MPNYTDEQKQYLKQVGANIRKIRQEFDISQEELAVRAGLDRTYIGAVERGERNISILNLAKIAKTLGFTVSEIIKG
jgi:transcriptional regulator with XRE-family HTH domain